MENREDQRNRTESKGTITFFSLFFPRYRSDRPTCGYKPQDKLDPTSDQISPSYDLSTSDDLAASRPCFDSDL